MSARESKVLVLACKIKFKSTINEQSITSFTNDYFELSDNDVSVNGIDWFDKDNFEENLENLISFAHDIKNKLKGDVLVYVKTSDDAVNTGKYHITSKGWKYSTCEINISVKAAAKDKPKALTEEEKIALFREYWENKHSAPAKNEIYKGFRIGAFYTTAMKNEDLITLLKDIMA